jgi:hypothetical protein
MNLNGGNYLPFGQYITTFLPPLLILGVNQIILILNDTVSVLERHHSHSNYQGSIFIKAVIYLNLNMLLIPAISFGSSDSMFVLLMENNYNPKEILSDIYFSDTGFFFVALIIQQGCLSATFYITR